jgi:LacI family transcriptional regulator
MIKSIIVKFMHKPATQSDVAKVAQVSTATVSRVLNQPDSVSPTVRLRVEQAMGELNYVADAAARALASKRSQCIGAVIPTIAHSIFAEGLEAFEAALNQANYGLMLTNSGYDEDQEWAQIRTLIERGVDAIMLVGYNHKPQVYELLQQRNIPYVLTWAFRQHSHHPCVGFDNFISAQHIPEHLLKLGHRRFGLITGLPQHNDRVIDRLQGVQLALASHGIELADNAIVQCSYDMSAGRRACHDLMSLEPPPTAIMCSNDVLAIGALLECQANGIAVPQTVSIAGFDDLAISQNFTPSLTTMHVPAKLMGKKAAQYLVASLAGEQTPQHTLVDVSLVERNSCAAPPLR